MNHSDQPSGRSARDIAFDEAEAFLADIGRTPVDASASVDDVVAALDGPLPVDGSAPSVVVEELVDALRPGVVASSGPRYFGFVTGGALESTVAAEWLASAWDQNAALEVLSPAMAAVEEVAAGWVLGVLGLPGRASVGFVTGGTMANFVGLAAGRHRLLADAGWDVEADGLAGAPPLRLVCGAEAHASLFNAAQYLGLGSATWQRVEVDAQGRMRPDILRDVLDDGDGPALVAAQAGNVNSGAFDPLPEIVEACCGDDVWLHLDGAFGLWVRASDQLGHLAAGAERADSWAVDAHKWLNVPYDCGIAIVGDPAAHRAAMTIGAAYLTPGTGRDGIDHAPEASRRARGLGVYAALRELGRGGLAHVVERCCRLARRFADALDDVDGVTVTNEVVINQVVVAFDPPPGQDAAAFRDRVVAAIQRDGTCWAGPTTWQDVPSMRISVSNWRTTDNDIDRSVAAVLAAHRHCREAVTSPGG